jgi:hypothetical protein
MTAALGANNIVRVTQRRRIGAVAAVSAVAAAEVARRPHSDAETKA